MTKCAKILQGGPLPAISRVITPLIGVITPLTPPQKKNHPHVGPSAHPSLAFASRVRNTKHGFEIFVVGEEKKWDHVLFLGRGASKEQQNVSHQEKPTNKTEVQLRYTSILPSYRLNFINASSLHIASISWMYFGSSHSPNIVHAHINPFGTHTFSDWSFTYGIDDCNPALAPVYYSRFKK